MNGKEHWTRKGEVKLFLWQKASSAGKPKGTIVFVHGSSMSGRPTYDLQVPGRPDSSAMEWFAERGFDTWTMDNEGYGRSDKSRPINCDISNGADDLAAASDYVLKNSAASKLLVYGISSGALKAALFAQRHPERVARLALDAFVWTGEGSPTLAERKKRLPQYRAANRRPIDREMVRSIFTRDHPGTSDLTVVEAFADAVLALDSSVPTGTYVDMSANLPVLDPAKIRVPTVVLRSQWDGIATEQDVFNFFSRLPNPDKQLTVMPGIAHSSLRSKNWRMVYDIVDACCSRAAPVYTG